MKKVKILLASLLTLAVLFGFSGCGKNKNPITAKEFKSKMEEKSYTVTTSTNQYSNSSIKESYIAVAKNYGYQIEFIVLDSDDSAISMYRTNESNFEVEKNKATVKSYTTVSLANYAKYTLLANNKYKVISRIGNTLIYIDANANYKDEIKTVLDELGY